jgi:hypothetical protein
MRLCIRRRLNMLPDRNMSGRNLIDPNMHVRNMHALNMHLLNMARRLTRRDMWRRRVLRVRLMWPVLRHMLRRTLRGTPRRILLRDRAGIRIIRCVRHLRRRIRVGALLPAGGNFRSVRRASMCRTMRREDIRKLLS